jgi:hypothetical protein
LDIILADVADVHVRPHATSEDLDENLNPPILLKGIP